MKKLLASLVAALAVAGIAYGADVVGNGSKVTYPVGNIPFGWNYTDSTSHAQAIDASGNSWIRNYDSGSNTYQQNIINNPALTLTARVDSTTTGTLVAGYARACLVFNAQLDSLTSAARVAIYVRGSATSAVDTNSTFPWFSNASVSHSGATVDTASFKYTAGDSLTPASGEFVWTISPVASSANTGMNIQDAHKFVIPLYGYADGGTFPFPYVSVRVRLLHLSGTGKRVVLKCSVIGTN